MELTELKTLITEAVTAGQTKRWLTREEVMEEFGIAKACLNKQLNDRQNPLPYSSFGDKKKLIDRQDIDRMLERKKRNAE